MEERWDRLMYQRDSRLTGNPYKQNVSVEAATVECVMYDQRIRNSIFQSLETIPDAE